MTALDCAIAELTFIKNFSRLKKKIEKYTDKLSEFIAKSFPEEHLWQGSVLTTMFAKIYVTLFDTTPRIIQDDDSNKENMHIIIDEISIDTQVLFHLSFYPPLNESLQFHVRNIPISYVNFLNITSTSASALQYIAFDNGVLTNFFYYYLPLPFTLRALTIFCARAKKVLTILKKIHDICALPSPRADVDELKKYWQEIQTLINFFGGDDND